MFAAVSSDCLDCNLLVAKPAATAGLAENKTASKQLHSHAR
jgi:hypothetical protein